MTVKVHVTSVIQKVVDGQREFDGDGATVGELHHEHRAALPGLRAADHGRRAASYTASSTST